MNATQAKKAASTNSRVRISERNDWAAGAEGIVLGYRAASDKVSIGFVDATGNPTGETMMVPRSMVDLV
jgi:hypothetical protein